ncbi:MAG: adenine phosphoribosyltransferase [Polyangiales bacterium]
MAQDERIELLYEKVRDVPDFPKPGIVFKDITPMLSDAVTLRVCIQLLKERFQDDDVDAVVGIESRGFIFGAALAERLGVGFVPVRKPGKLPAKTFEVEYELEYGKDRLQIHQDGLEAGARVLVVDDLGDRRDCKSDGRMVRPAAPTLAYAFVIELDFFGRPKSDV